MRAKQAAAKDKVAFDEDMKKLKVRLHRFCLLLCRSACFAVCCLCSGTDLHVCCHTCVAGPATAAGDRA